jgi:hypothetical protein
VLSINPWYLGEFLLYLFVPYRYYNNHDTWIFLGDFNMASTEKYVIAKFDNQHYTQIAVEYILNHHGCTAADLLKNETRIGRKRFYKTILPTLRKKKLIREVKVRKMRGRHIMLFIKEDNPLYIVSKELKDFEDLYPCLLMKVKEQVQRWNSGKRLQKPKYLEYPEEFREPSDTLTELIFDMTLLLFETMRTYMFRSTMVWSRTIQDKFTREILNYTIFSKLYQMQNKMSEILGTITLGDATRGGNNVVIASVATELSEIKERVEVAK